MVWLAGCPKVKQRQFARVYQALNFNLRCTFLNHLIFLISFLFGKLLLIELVLTPLPAKSARREKMLPFLHHVATTATPFFAKQSLLSFSLYTLASTCCFFLLLQDFVLIFTRCFFPLTHVRPAPKHDQHPHSKQAERVIQKWSHPLS